MSVADVRPSDDAPTAHARAVTTLRAAILEGELQPGQRVSQEAWAARIGTSLIPVREALGTLAGEGLVTYRHRRGYAVSELDLDDLEEVYRLRRLLETEALQRGVPHAAEDDVAALSAAAAACAAADAHADVVGRLAANRRFHDLLHGLAGSSRLARLIEQLWDQTEAYRARYYALPGEVAEADAAHAALIEAVSRRDAAAAVRVQDDHRERALSALRVALRREQGRPRAAS